MSDLDPVSESIGSLTQRMDDAENCLIDLRVLRESVNDLKSRALSEGARDWAEERYRDSLAAQQQDMARRSTLFEWYLKVALVPVTVILSGGATALLHHIHWLGL